MKTAKLSSNVPTRINKALIFYSLMGVSTTAFLGGAIMIPAMIKKRNEQAHRATINLPDPDLNKLVKDYGIVPSEANKVAVPELTNQVSPPELQSYQASAVSQPPSLSSQGYRSVGKPEFIPDFAASAAASSMEVPVGNPTANTTNPEASAQSYQNPLSNRLQTYQMAQDLMKNYNNDYLNTQKTPTQYDLYNQANNQEDKKQFAETGTGGPTDVLGANSIAPGTVIPATLVTGLNTDLPGYLMAQVSENIYDYVSGRNLLVPAGSRLLARYNSVISFGQQRVQVGWSEMITPSGVVVNLGNAPGIDPIGQSGVAGKVDNHFDKMLGGMGFSALTTLLTGVSTSLVEQMLNQGALSSTFEEVVARLGDIGYEIAKRWMNVQPTITLKAGSRISVFVVNKLTLPATEKAGEIKKYTRSNK